MNQLTRVAKLVTGAPGRVAGFANSIVNIGRTVLTNGQQFHDTLTRQSAEEKSLSNNVSDVTRSAKYFGKTVDAQRDLARAAKDMELAQRATLAS